MSEGVVVDVAQLEEALLTRAMGIVIGLADIEPDPRAPDVDAEVLDAALAAATGLHQLLAFRRAGTTATTFAEQAEATAGLQSATEQLTKAAEAVTGLLELAEYAARAGAQDLN
ncbi:hypothetical protein [Actinoallomurus sp. NPDC050550]|uniref:hypothetical protein n=1 Tax=Actinoallomurus sp. NPDC050550 TaxID=3154937 RepID=UPI0033D017D5